MQISSLIFFLNFHQTRPSVWDLATGSTASSDTNPPASATGPAGTRRPLSSSVSAVCSTTKRSTLAIGPRPSRDARNIVRIHLALDRLLARLTFTQIIRSFDSFVQGRRQRQCATRQILQPLLGLPGRLPPSAALPGHFGLRQALAPLHQPLSLIHI